MFGKLPELLNRNFAIGFFLPIATFGIISLGLADIFGVFTALLTINNFNDLNTLIGTTVLLLVSWLGGVFLLATNRDIIRIMEGYGSLNPMHIFKPIEKRRYKKLTTRIAELNRQRDHHKARGETFPDKLRNERAKLIRESADHFPDDEHWLLPTAFGNTVRAFEVYSRAIYGIDAIVGWNRLLAVIPADYRGLIDDAKTYVDFWANTWLLSLAIFVEYAALAAYTHQKPMLWIPFVAILNSALAFYRARSNAVEWGDLVKSAFDVYLPELRTKLALPPSKTQEEEVNTWLAFSRAALFRQPKTMPRQPPFSNAPAQQPAPPQPSNTPPQQRHSAWKSNISALLIGSFLIWLVNRLAKGRAQPKRTNK